MAPVKGAKPATAPYASEKRRYNPVVDCACLGDLTQYRRLHVPGTCAAASANGHTVTDGHRSANAGAGPVRYAETHGHTVACACNCAKPNAHPDCQTNTYRHAGA